ncbi:hypothetical protein A6A27_11790 [Micromonospora sp. CB01531]|nr:hypothetical protein A6A27_11790 [Micromonospora sp. CB01531]
MRVKIADAARFIANLCPFTAGSLRGDCLQVLSGVAATGELPAEYAETLREAQRERTARYLAGEGREAVPHAPAYVVTSYGTPIAWVTLAGEVVIPPMTYSATTTRHQALVRAALGAELVAA